MKEIKKTSSSEFEAFSEPRTGELSNRLMVDFLAFVGLWGDIVARYFAIFDKTPPVWVKISDNYTLR